MSLKAINAALATAVQGCGLLYPIAWEGKTFTPPSAAPWIAVWLLPAFTDAMQTIDKHGGILQVDVNHPLNAGAPAVMADVDKLLAYFKAGRRFITGSQAVTVRKREASRIQQIDGWLRASVSVSYRAGSPI